MPYVYKVEPTEYIGSVSTDTATITAYDHINKIITLDTPINVSLGYNTKIGDVTSQYNLTGNITTIADAIQKGNTLSKFSSDEAGNFVGIFNVPGGIFQTGNRVFRVDNRTVPTDPTTATTFAEATFTASGLATTSQKLEFAPSVDSAASAFVQVSQRDNQLIRTRVVTTVTYRDPIAQTFIVNKTNFPNGIFLRSIKVFFRSKPTTNIPVTLSIVGTLNGYPNGQKLDYSTVTLNANEVVTSQNPHYLDASTYTEFMFKAPVYIQGDVLYAFMLETSSADYTVYYAQQNSTAVPSTAKALPTDPNPTVTSKIGQTPYVGGLFESQNAITWQVDQSKQLMFVIDRCIFNTSVTPSIQFSIPKGLPYRKLGSQDIQYKLDANTMTNLFGSFGTTTWSDAVNLTTTDFVPTSTRVNYSYTSILAEGNVPVGPFPATPGKLGSPTQDDITFDDGRGQRALIKTINDTFSMYATLSSSDPNVSPIISDDGVTVYSIQNIINNMGISNNVISLANTGSGYTDPTNTSIVISAPDIGSDPATLGFVVANNGTSNVISSVYVINEGSGYITTPTIRITGANTTPANVVVYGETSTRGGNSFARYFTKKVVLTPGNDSGDLRVFCTAYKPLGTGIYVYYKILNRNDTQPFEDGSWQLMTQVGNPNVYSLSKDNLIEYEFAPGVDNVADNFISYTSTNGETYTQFSQFAIKVVFSSDDSPKVPYLSDIRALALPSGTGI
jgi:hypothetical protein